MKAKIRFVLAIIAILGIVTVGVASTQTRALNTIQAGDDARFPVGG
jgi:hypothetical protein